MTAPTAHPERRSSRVPVKVPIRVTSMEPRAQFSEVCETLVVSAHGCALRSRLETGDWEHAAPAQSRRPRGHGPRSFLPADGVR